MGAYQPTEVRGAYKSTVEDDIKEMFSSLRAAGCSHAGLDECAVRLQRIMCNVRRGLREGVENAMTRRSQISLQGSIREFISTTTLLTVPQEVRSKYKREKSHSTELIPGRIREVPIPYDCFGIPGHHTPGLAKQYICLPSDILKNLARDEELVNHWQRSTTQVPLQPQWSTIPRRKVHWHPCLGRRAKALKKDTNRKTLFLELYSDDTNHGYGLSRNKRVTNLCHGYVGVKNTVGFKSRRTQYWQTCHLSYSKQYSKGNASAKWGKVVRDLVKLVKEGITLGQHGHFGVRVYTFSGDQKEIHDRSGMSTGFGGRYFDRFSYMTKVARQTARSTRDLHRARECRRTPTSSEVDAKKLKENPRLKSERGLVRAAPGGEGVRLRIVDHVDRWHRHSGLAG